MKKLMLCAFLALIFAPFAAAMGRPKPPELAPAIPVPVTKQAKPAIQNPAATRKTIITGVIAECLENTGVLTEAIKSNSKGRGVLEPEYREKYDPNYEPKLIEKTVYDVHCNSIKIRRSALMKFVRERKKLFTFSAANEKKWADLEWNLKNIGILDPGESVKIISFKDCEETKKLFESLMTLFNAAKITGNAYDFNF